MHSEEPLNSYGFTCQIQDEYVFTQNWYEQLSGNIARVLLMSFNSYRLYRIKN